MAARTPNAEGKLLVEGRSPLVRQRIARRARRLRFRRTVNCTGAAPAGQNRQVKVSSLLAVTRTLPLRTW